METHKGTLTDATSPPCSLMEWTSSIIADDNHELAPHHRRLLADLELLSRGDISRLMISMPPGAAKSSFGSILFPTWWLAQHPQASIIVVSHTANLAEYLSRRARSVVVRTADRLGYGLAVGDRATGHWSTSQGGEYYAIGMRGAVVGRRADLAIIDDPIRSQVEADNALSRDRVWQWYQSELVPRLKPGGRILLIMTRWHEDDLCGRLLRGDTSDWHSLSLPAFAGALDPLGRPTHCALWPEWEDAHALLHKRISVGQRTWHAQFQQTPRTPAGTFFKVACLDIVDDVSQGPLQGVVRAWDLAATNPSGTTDPDWTVGVKLMREGAGRYKVLHIVRMRGSPRQVENCILSTADIDGRHVTIGLPEDPGQAGKSQVTYLSSRLPGFVVKSSRETGTKLTRAMPVASQMEANNIALVRGDWNHAFIDELKEFPAGRKDDQVDALSRAFHLLLEVAQPARRIAVPYLGR